MLLVCVSVLGRPRVAAEPGGAVSEAEALESTHPAHPREASRGRATRRTARPAPAEPTARHEPAAVFTAIRCPLPVDIGATEATLVTELAHDKGEEIRAFAAPPAPIEDGTVLLRILEHAMGPARLSIPGFLDVEFDLQWNEEGIECPEIELFPAARVTGQVQGDTTDLIDVQVCGTGASMRGETGRFEWWGEPDLDCEAYARRQDGALVVEGPHLLVTTSLAGDEIALELPRHRQGGIGVGVLEAPDGIRLVSVRLGGPAAGAGLRDEDVVIAVDDVSAAAMRVEDFQRLVIGEIGVPVRLTVRRGAEEVVVEVERGWIER